MRRTEQPAPRTSGWRVRGTHATASTRGCGGEFTRALRGRLVAPQPRHDAPLGSVLTVATSVTATAGGPQPRTASVAVSVGARHVVYVAASAVGPVDK